MGGVPPRPDQSQGHRRIIWGMWSQGANGEDMGPMGLRTTYGNINFVVWKNENGGLAGETKTTNISNIPENNFPNVLGK